MMKRKLLAHSIYLMLIMLCISCQCFKRIDNLSEDNKTLRQVKEILDKKVDSGEKTILLNAIEKKLAANDDKLSRKFARRGASKIKSAANSLLNKPTSTATPTSTPIP